MTDKIKKEATITFCGGATGPTGSNFLFETEERKVLIDCGLFQGERINEEKNDEPFPYDPNDIDVLFVTHAHLDHIGRIPNLVQQGFSGKIYSTPSTRDITKLMLTDSIRVMERQARERGMQPPYDEEDVQKIMSLWEVVDYHTPVSAGGDVTVTFYDAGHILGSAMVELEYNGKKALFTGDLGNTPAPLLNETETPENISCLVMESVYGDRNHENRDERRSLVRSVVKDTIGRGGVLMIPVFSIERTQEMLFELNHMVENKEIPLVPVFLDSPLAIKVTDVYKEHQSEFNDRALDIIASGDDIFSFPLLRFTKDVEDSKAIAEVEGPKIIMAGSGMMNGGRIIHHAKRYLSDKKNTLLLVGYQAVGTLGRKLQEGEKNVQIDDDNIPVRANVTTVHGYSAHKQSDDLLEFVEDIAEKGDLAKVFVVLGEPKSASFLSQKLRDHIGVDATVAKDGERVTLLF